MELGKNLGRIVDYGVTKTKAGEPQVFVKFEIGSEFITWFGSPFLKTGEPNIIMFNQLAYCGFDVDTHEFDKLALGLECGYLVTDEDVDVIIADEIIGDGTLRRKVKSIGEVGPARVTNLEAKGLLSAERMGKIKGLSGKLKVRKKVVKPNPDIEEVF